MNKYDVVSDTEIDRLIDLFVSIDLQEEDLDLTDREVLIITRALENLKETNNIG